MEVELPAGLVVEALDPEHRNFDTLREERQGVMLHYDASHSDEASLTWLRHPAFTMSYNHIVFKDGLFLEMAPRTSAHGTQGTAGASAPMSILT